MRILRGAAVGFSCLLAAAATGRAQTSDYDAVESALAALNNPAARASLFTPDADGRLLLEGLLGAPAATLHAQAVPLLEDSAAAVLRAPGLSVELVISSEPMGEAQLVPINLWLAPITIPRTSAPSPHLISHHIRFITADVASIDAVIENPAQSFENLQSAGGDLVLKRPASTELVLIMVKEDGNWRVAMARVTK